MGTKESLHPMQIPAILVTGGSGYIGEHLVDKLCRNGELVIPLYRRKMPQPHDNVLPIAADLGAKELLAAPLRGVQTVVHLAWEKNFVGTKSENANQTTHNIKNLKNLLEVMGTVRTKRIVFLSVIGATKDSTEPFLKEKYEAEQLILNSNIKEKIILRCSVVYGGKKEGGFIQSIKRIMKSSIFYPLPKNRTKINPLHIDDLCAALVELCSFKMYDSCAIIDLAGGEAYKVNHLFKIFSQKYYKKNRFAIGTFLGESIIRLFERNLESEIPKLGDYLTVGSLIEKKIRYKNPLVKILPEKLKTFEESINCPISA